MPQVSGPQPAARAGASLPRRIVTSRPAETEALGRRLGRLLRAGDVIALSGDLGAGKTVLARGIADGVGAAGYIASPTFTLIREYHGPLTVYHVDLYRLDRPRQLEDLGLDEILDGTGVVVIEWAEKAIPLLPAEHLWIEIRYGRGDLIREVLFVARGARYDEISYRVARAGTRSGARDRRTRRGRHVAGRGRTR